MGQEGKETVREPRLSTGFTLVSELFLPLGAGLMFFISVLAFSVLIYNVLSKQEESDLLT